MNKMDPTLLNSEILLYAGKDDKLRLETRLHNGSVWLSQNNLIVTHRKHMHICRP
jgi:hypothetical protein